MVDPRDNVSKQARSGSVAAIIQLLNEKLADSGIRTRAVRENNLLQLLCEAETVEQLEKSTLVPRIQEILESIAPQNIRRVKINSRIVREQQLLWLEEINRDPENQLLWVEEIKLAKPNPFNYLGTEWRDRKTKLLKQSLLKPSLSPFERDRRQLRRGVVVGVIFSLSLLLGAWAVYTFLASGRIAQTKPTKLGSSISPSSTQQNAKVSKSTAKQVSATQSISDPFAAAVRLAEDAVGAGQVAQTPAQWLEIAAQWQKASDLMASVPSNDNRYKMAQNRKVLYRQSSEEALRQAEKRRSKPEV